MTDTATLTQRLAEAEAALHRLSMGDKLVKVDYGASSATYQQADKAGLRAHIAELRQQLGLGGRAGALTVRVGR